MKKLTREQILDLRNSFGVWRQDYDSVHDKEQHDMFALAVVAMDEMLAAMDGEDAERREWMAQGVDSLHAIFNEAGTVVSPSFHSAMNTFMLNIANKIRSGEVE